MLRDKSLIPLSHQHQRALALCVRIDRAEPNADRDLEAWQREMEQQFQEEIEGHFAVEEHVIFPVARQFPELIPLVEELLSDHRSLTAVFTQARSRQLSSRGLSGFAKQLSGHIRKEERQLFERLQGLLDSDQLTVIGSALVEALKDNVHACKLASNTTQLRAAQIAVAGSEPGK
jgi:hemerythrin-like domain-containing protein